MHVREPKHDYWSLVVILDIVQLAMVCAKAPGLSASYVVMWDASRKHSVTKADMDVWYRVNTYVTIIGVVFATVWAGGARYMQEHDRPSHSISTAFRSDVPVSRMVFERGPLGTTISAFEEHVPPKVPRHSATEGHDEESATIGVSSKGANVIELSATRSAEAL
jgi:hypothetical protein